MPVCVPDFSWMILVAAQNYLLKMLQEESSLARSVDVHHKWSLINKLTNNHVLFFNAAMQSKRDQENYKPQVQPSLAHYTMTPSPKYHQSPMQSSTSPLSSVSKRPFQLVNQSSVCFQPLSHGTGCNHFYNTQLDCESPTENSDFERCSLDYEPSSSTEFDHHSSEDELAIINCGNHELHPEKRKWSQVNRCNSCDDSSCSSDEELRDLLGEPKPLNFSSSPPKGVQKLSRTLSPPLFLANLSPKSVRLCSVSPRKRHRQTNSSDVSDATVIQRPCLDFEKMQVSSRCFSLNCRMRMSGALFIM